MLDDFLTFINNQNLFEPHHKILLTVSGGMDSVVMCDLFSKAKIPFGIAHCNFGLRGEESNEDELFVKKLAIKYKVAFHVTTFETALFAEKEQLSTQMAARTLRYEWFEKTRQNFGYDLIATAHHQNDVLETILLNITKGTGIAGLHGIQIKNGHIIRPIWFTKKDDIFDYVVENQIIWREDSSNESNKYQRNLIRNEVIPLLKQINPNIEQTLMPTIERVKTAEDLFFEEIELLKKQVIWTDNNAVYVNYKAIQSLKNGIVMLSELLKTYHFNFAQSTEIYNAFDLEAGRSFISPTHILVKDRNELVITPKNLQEFQSYNIDKETTSFDFGDKNMMFTFSEINEGFKIDSNKNMALLDAEKVRFPLQLRKVKTGDWFCPLGMNKKKLLSDFLTDLKTPLNLKKEVYVLTSNGSIVWVVGLRIDDRFKVTDKSKQLLTIKIK
ncbi:MAG: tRNA lysidine(34) synthetase TilS [Pseudarcicella sp.]|nr:tRNA lysidine(34) synthetase TilS [Pseudarcicella sp.]MBP6410629.1 tRNA lysidine(34) synthetase TilS [Pseudarcicella sp.]